MGQIINHNLPCLDESCGSSDARQLYEDGTSFCFSCQGWFRAQEGEDLTPVKLDPVLRKIKLKNTNEEINEILDDCPKHAIKSRGISKQVCEFFDVRVSYNSDGEQVAHYYPYNNNSAFKVRDLPKQFRWVGKSSDLFGRDKFNGGGRRVVITEGEIDALSVAQATLEKNGKISTIELGQTSNVPEYDESALRAVRVTDPLPSLPHAVTVSSVKGVCNFWFNLNKQK